MLFEGRIRTLSQVDANGWLRREIIVQKDPNKGLPKVGDTWTLIDSDRDIYKLSFIKGANVSGYTCLGQPGKLKNWFLKHYLRNDVERTEITPVTHKTFANIGWREVDLEKLIAKNMLRLIPQNQLLVLFQERPFQEAADIYALDRKGDLYIFELKRWQGHQENILQVLRYGQIYGQYSYEQLQEMLQKYEKIGNLDLAGKHYEYFEEVIPNKLNKTDFNRQQHFIVITNGTDLDTRNAIKYWQDKGLLIDSIIILGL